MNSIKKVAGYNLVVLLIYTIYIAVTSRTGSVSEKDLDILLASAFLISIQIVVNLFIAGIYFGLKNRDLGKSFLLSALIVALVGFSTCVGNAAL